MDIRKQGALKAWRTRRHKQAFFKAKASEVASKAALRAYCKKRGWKVAFFEGSTGAPRTGIVDAIMFRIARGRADILDVRFVQLKGGGAGISGAEIGRLKRAVTNASTGWCIAAYDGETLHVIPEDTC